MEGKKKKLGEESKTSFPIFKSVKNVESKTLQNNQLKIKENQNQCEKLNQNQCWTLIRNWYRENCNTFLWCRNIQTKITGRIENFQKRKLFDRAYVPPKNC